jgi:hypothetical protein
VSVDRAASADSSPPRFLGRSASGGNDRTPQPEIARAFPDDESVNAALKAVIDARARTGFFTIALPTAAKT